jgi:hypothetical protein
MRELQALPPIVAVALLGLGADLGAGASPESRLSLSRSAGYIPCLHIDNCPGEPADREPHFNVECQISGPVTNLITIVHTGSSHLITALTGCEPCLSLPTSTLLCSAHRGRIAPRHSASTWQQQHHGASFGSCNQVPDRPVTT